jgi:hypothetical protein
MDEASGKRDGGESPAAKGAKAGREARLAQALRDNLRRRKAAARGPAETPPKD